MQFRRLNDAGLAAFRSYLQTLRDNPKLDPPVFLLSDDSHSEPLDPPISAEPLPFENRMAFAQWLHSAAESAGHLIPRQDAGFWAWLSLALFDQVCPWKKEKRNKWKGTFGRFPGDDARHLPMFSDFRRSYRHLLSGPYSIYYIHRRNPEIALAALINSLDEPGDLSENLGGSRLHYLCPGTMALATRLFVNLELMKPHTGAGSASNRLGKLMNQYTRTWDLPKIDVDHFVPILPNDLERFKKAAESSASVAAP